MRSSETPPTPLLPAAAPLPRGWWAVLVGLLPSAWLVLWPTLAFPGYFPGDPARAEPAVTVALHHLVHSRGLPGLLADDLGGYPARTDRLVLDGAPIDALTSAPFVALGGLELGFWAWTVALVWAFGAASAWLAMRWWGSASAGIVAGVAALTSEAMWREVGEGRTSGIVAMVFVVLAAGSAWRAADGRAGTALVAGILAGVATLAEWWSAALVLAALVVPQVAVAFRRGSAGGAAGLGAAAASTTLMFAAFGAVVGMPVAWVLGAWNESPSLGMDPWSPAFLAFTRVRPVDLSAWRTYGADGLLVATLGRVAVGLAALAAVVHGHDRPRSWVMLVFALCGTAVLALGSALPGPVVLPWGMLQLLPGFSRAWWPDRAWMLVAVVAGVLAGGAVRRGAARRAVGGAIALAAVIAVEALVRSTAWPIPGVALRPSPAAEALAVAPDVPLVLLPLGEGRFRPDRLELVDQIHHGRPVAQGTRPPFDMRGSDASLRAWRENAGLRALASCELGSGELAPEGAGEALARAGLREVWVDSRYVSERSAEGAQYLRCVEGVVGAWRRTEPAPFTRWQR